MKTLHKLNDLVYVKVIARPSKVCKTPYVADIELDNGSIVQAHCASLGCCGLCEKDCYVYASPMKSNCIQSKSKVCSYKIYLAQFCEEKVIKDQITTNTQLIGIDPKLAETLVENALTQNYLKTLTHIKTYKREVCLLNSRFDFAGIDEHGKYFVLEVKNVPLADYADVSSTDRKKMIKNGDFANIAINQKISYFPDGYRKKKDALVSERALKHINELALIKRMSKTRCIMCYVIQRTDVDRFQPSIIDPEYREAFKEAVKSGVEIITMVVQWTREGEAYFIKDDLFINI